MEWDAISAIIVATIAAVGGLYKAYREIQARAYAQAKLTLTQEQAEQTITDQAATIAALEAEQARLRAVIATLLANRDDREPES